MKKDQYAAQKQHVLGVLQQQKRDRQAQLDQEKYEDKVYSQLEQQRLAKEDYRRQEYFKNIHHYQEKNDEKYKALKDYKALNIDQLARQDEEKQVLSMQR